jgi:hypothetical protein
MASKVSQVCAILDGAHVMGFNPLGDYHAAKECVGALRMVGRDRQIAALKRATKNYNVMVSPTPAGYRFFRPSDKKELFLECVSC